MASQKNPSNFPPPENWMALFAPPAGTEKSPSNFSAPSAPGPGQFRRQFPSQFFYEANQDQKKLDEFMAGLLATSGSRGVRRRKVWVLD